MNTPTKTGYIISKCPSTTQLVQCDWTGDLSECKRIRDTDFGRWFYYWYCPKCGSKVSELNHNSPLTHPLQRLVA
jgi:hypothetical protein